MEPPAADFDGAYQHAVYNQPLDAIFSIEVDLASTVGTITDLFGAQTVEVELRATEGLDLGSSGVDSWSVDSSDPTIHLTQAVASSHPAKVELWLSAEGTGATFRVQYIVCDLHETWALDTPGLSGCVGCEHLLNLNIPTDPTNVDQGECLGIVIPRASNNFQWFATTPNGFQRLNSV